MKTSAKQYRQLSESILTSLANSASDKNNIVYWRRIYIFLKAITGAEVAILEDGVMASVNGSTTITKDKE